MKKDNIINANLYYNLSNNLKLGLEYLENTDFSSVEDGRYEILDTDVYAVVQSYVSKPLDQGKFEAHKKYTDIQFIIEGEEQMGFAHISEFENATQYDEEKDIVFLAPKEYCRKEFIKMQSNEFIIFDPNDAHMPSIAINQPSFVRKVVVKVNNV